MCHPGAQEWHFRSLQLYPEEQFAFLKWNQLRFTFITDTLKPEKNQPLLNEDLHLKHEQSFTQPILCPYLFQFWLQNKNSAAMIPTEETSKLPGQQTWLVCLSRTRLSAQGLPGTACFPTGNCLLSLGDSWDQNWCPWQYLTCKHLKLFSIVLTNKNTGLTLVSEIPTLV